MTDLPLLEAAGIVVRVPGTWGATRPPRPQVSATVGSKASSGLGTDALLDFRMEVTLDGERLTAAEIAKLLAGSKGLHLVRGRWIELDRDKLGRMLDQFRAFRDSRFAAQRALRPPTPECGMLAGRTVFAQLMTHVSQKKFQTCVAHYHGDYKASRLSCWDQYLCMAFAQLTYRESLRDIEACLRAVQSRLYHVGIRARVSRSRPL